MIYSFKTVMISLKNGKFLIPTPHYNFCIVHWRVLLKYQHQTLKVSGFLKLIFFYFLAWIVLFSTWEILQTMTFKAIRVTEELKTVEAALIWAIVKLTILKLGIVSNSQMLQTASFKAIRVTKEVRTVGTALMWGIVKLTILNLRIVSNS